MRKREIHIYNEEKNRGEAVNEKNVLHVIGHMHPDTDSIASAIGYAFLKRTLGQNAKAYRLGDLNDETRYLLERFDFQEPPLLEDARISLKDLDLDHPQNLKADMTIFDVLSLMQKDGHQGFGVVNENGVLIGIVTRSDISIVGLGDTALGIDLLKETPVENIVRSIDGQLIFKAENSHLDGRVSIVALTKTFVRNYQIQDRIVIVGDDPAAQKELIEKGAGMLIMVWTKHVQEDVLQMAKEHQCHIIISGHGSMNTSRYLYFSVPVGLIMTKDIVTFGQEELVDIVKKNMGQTRYRMYPVVDDFYRPIGYVTRNHMMEYQNRSIVMVDHNEFSQSVQGIEFAELVEVLDHHRIYDFVSAKPVSFRNEIVGSTATIVASMFKENQIPIPQNLAGLLLGAILSDTLKFQSPTTTPKDRQVAAMLAAFANLDLDSFATDLFTISSDISKQSMEKLIDSDRKCFSVRNAKVSISQVLIPCIEYLEGSKDQIEETCCLLIERYSLDLCVVVFTSILENGSVFYSYGNKASVVQNEYTNGTFQKGVLSRKTQILPKINELLIRY